MTGADAPGAGPRAGGTDNLVEALAAMELTCSVEPHGTLAILVVEADRYAQASTLLEAGEVRDGVLRAARAFGFTHVALELREEEN